MSENRFLQSFCALKWGLIPHWCTDSKGGRRPINAKDESLSSLPTFRDAYAQRRCIVPVDGFFEGRATRGARKQPYAIAMKDGSPFGLAGLWENWRNPKTGEWERTLVVITVPSNELVGVDLENSQRGAPRSSMLLRALVGPFKSRTRYFFYERQSNFSLVRHTS